MVWLPWIWHFPIHIKGWNVIIPTDEVHHFFRGVESTNQTVQEEVAKHGSGGRWCAQEASVITKKSMPRPCLVKPKSPKKKWSTSTSVTSVTSVIIPLNRSWTRNSVTYARNCERFLRTTRDLSPKNFTRPWGSQRSLVAYPLMARCPRCALLLVPCCWAFLALRPGVPGVRAPICRRGLEKISGESGWLFGRWGLCVCVAVSMHMIVCIYIYIYLFIYLFIFIHIYIYKYIYIYIRCLICRIDDPSIGWHSMGKIAIEARVNLTAFSWPWKKSCTRWSLFVTTKHCGQWEDCGVYHLFLCHHTWHVVNSEAMLWPQARRLPRKFHGTHRGTGGELRSTETDFKILPSMAQLEGLQPSMVFTPGNSEREELWAKRRDQNFGRPWDRDTFFGGRLWLKIWGFPEIGLPQNGWFLWTGKSHRSKWMITGGTPMTSWKPPYDEICQIVGLPWMIHREWPLMVPWVKQAVVWVMDMCRWCGSWICVCLARTFPRKSSPLMADSLRSRLIMMPWLSFFSCFICYIICQCVFTHGYIRHRKHWSMLGGSSHES